MLEEALALYGFAGLEAEFIRHNENMTYRVGGKYLLRIHRHKDGFTTDAVYGELDRARLRETELSFLSHLAARGMKVQTPIPDTRGRLVSRLSDGTAVTVLSWLEGRTVDRRELSPALCREMGGMAARLRKAAESFPAHFALRYDDALCRRLGRKLETLVADGTLTPDDAGALSDSLEAVGELLRRSEDEFLFAHTDLSLSNMLITDGGLVPIDFSLGGWGHPAMDISELFCAVYGDVNRSALLDGYREEYGSVPDPRAIDCCFALNVLLGVILHCETWTREDWFPGKLKVWREEIFEPLARGERVIVPADNAVPAGEKDIPAWLELVKLVSADFPGLDLADYELTLRKNIARGTALCVREDGNIVGILLFSPGKRCLSCMAVRPDYRRRGIASLLVGEMLRRMHDGDISVTTFREDDPKGTAPRALYRKFGFRPGETGFEFDYPVQKFVLEWGAGR